MITPRKMLRHQRESEITQSLPVFRPHKLNVAEKERKETISKLMQEYCASQTKGNELIKLSQLSMHKLESTLSKNQSFKSFKSL